jgi:hypothetical protein
VSHAAFRTITWGVIPFSVLAGGIIVDALAAGHGILGAAKLTMVGGTLIGTLFAAIPLAPINALLRREREAAPAELTEVTA